MKIYAIQILRGGAAWMVVIHHFMQHFFHFESTNFLGDFFSNYGMFGVDIFFIISGFIMAFILSNSSDRNYKKFIKNRIIRIVPNYWIWTLVILLMGLVIDALSSSHATAESVLMSLFFISHLNPSPLLGYYPTLTVGWTLNYEMFFYVLIAIILLFRLSVFKTLSITLFVLLLLPISYKIIDFEFYRQIFGNIKLFEFALGIILFYIWRYHTEVFYNKFMIFFIITLFIPFYFVSSSSGLVIIFVASVIVYMALVLEKYLNVNWWIVGKLVDWGEMSYSTYLVHPIILWLLHFMVSDLHSIYLVLPILLIYIVLTYFLSKLSHYYIEIKLSKKLKDKFVT